MAFKNPYRDLPAFNLDRAVFVLNTENDVSAAIERLKIEAVTRDRVTDFLVEEHDDRPIIVVGHEDSVEFAQSLIDAGRGSTLVRAAMLPSTESFGSLAEHNTAYLHSLCVNNVDPVLWPKVRPLSQWGERPLTELIPCGIPAMENHLRWAFPSLSVWVGGYGSGKSTLACMAAMKAMLTPEGIGMGLKTSFCCFEDDLTDFRFRTEAQAMAANGDARAFIDLQNRSYWFDETLPRPKGLDDYLNTVCRLTTQHGVRVHIFDPWTAHVPELERGQREQQYIQDRLNDMQQLTKELKINIHVICHTTKSAQQGPGRIKPIRLSDAHGAGDFGKFADYGFCVVRSKWLANLINGSRSEDGFDNITVGEAMKAGHVETSEHACVVIDKVRRNGIMGFPEQFAFSIDSVTQDIIHDPAASILLRKAWEG